MECLEGAQGLGQDLGQEKKANGSPACFQPDLATSHLPLPTLAVLLSSQLPESLLEPRLTKDRVESCLMFQGLSLQSCD